MVVYMLKGLFNSQKSSRKDLARLLGKTLTSVPKGWRVEIDLRLENNPNLGAIAWKGICELRASDGKYFLRNIDIRYGFEFRHYLYLL
jgi:hypothetical protein